MLLVSVFIAFFAAPASATDFSSSNFTVRDPVIEIASSTEMSSASFRMTGSIGQMSIGTSTSVTYEVRSGFLYFPKVTLPVPSASAGDGSVTLSWTASQGFLGWTVSGYTVGQGTVSGGPYSYTSVGNVLTSTRTGLTNGTTYYFVILPKDAFGNLLATSTEVSGTPAASAAPSPAPSTPSGGAGGGIILDLLKVFGYPAVPPSAVLQREKACLPDALPTDLNCDGRVNLADFSIFLFFSPELEPSQTDFNQDARTDISDMSVLFHDWTDRLLTFVPERAQEIPPKEERAPEEGLAPQFAAVGESPLEARIPAAEIREGRGWIYTLYIFGGVLTLAIVFLSGLAVWRRMRN